MATLATCMVIAAKYPAARMWRVVTWDTLTNHVNKMICIYDDTSDDLCEFGRYNMMFLVGCMLLDLQRVDFNIKEKDLLRIQKCMRSVVSDMCKCQCCRSHLQKLSDYMNRCSSPRSSISSLSSSEHITIPMLGRITNFSKRVFATLRYDIRKTLEFNV